MNTPRVSKSALFSWCLFDWARSAFSTVVMTFIFAVYFTESVAKTTIMGTKQWGNAIAVAGVIIALTSPILGAIADHQGKRKPWIATFITIVVLSTLMLWWIPPDHAYVMPMLILVVLGIVGLEVSGVFYNAMLRYLAPATHIGRISGWAWGIGYAGGLACLLIALIVFVNPESAIIPLNHQTAEQVRICGPFAALWILVFAIPLFIWTPDESLASESRSVCSAFRESFATLSRTLRILLTQHKTIFLFLIAYMLYMDGLNTLFAFGGIYAAGTFGFSMSQVLIFGIAMSASAGVGAISFAWLDDFWGAKTTILLSLLGLFLLGVAVLLVRSEWWFWRLALSLGLFVGPVQAASRSLMARLAPRHLMNELFGLYALSGKATAFLNPFLVGLLTSRFQSQRIGLSSVMMFIFVGGLLLLCTRLSKVLDDDDVTR